MRLKSQLTSPTVAVDRNVNNTDMDAIRAVNERIEEIEKIGTEEALADIAELADVDFTEILESVDKIEGLTVKVVKSLPAGQASKATLVGNEIQLELTAGPNGTDGLNGLTPVYEFVFNDVSGMLSYELVGYSNINTGSDVIVSGDIDYELVKDEVIERLNTPEEW